MVLSRVHVCLEHTLECWRSEQLIWKLLIAFTLLPIKICVICSNSELHMLTDEWILISGIDWNPILPLGINPHPLLPSGGLQLVASHGDLEQTDYPPVISTTVCIFFVLLLVIQNYELQGILKKQFWLNIYKSSILGIGGWAQLSNVRGQESEKCLDNTWVVWRVSG